MLRSLLTALRGVPTLAYAFIGCVALGAWQEVRVSSAYERGKTDERNNARFDSGFVAMVDSARAQKAARVDTIRDTVRVRVDRVRDVIVRVPDSIRVLVPVVDTLVIESRALVRAVDSLATALDAERAANALALTVTRDAVREARLENARQAAMILVLDKRPRWTTLALTDGIAFGVGYGVARVKR